VRAVPGELPCLPFPFAEHPVGIAACRLEGDGDLLGGAPRSRQYATLIYVEGGHGRHREGPLSWEAARRSLFVAAPGETHDARGLGAATGWVLRFAPSALVGGGGVDELRLPQPGEPLWRVLVRSGRTQHVVPEARSRCWSWWLSMLDDELASRGRGYEQAARSLTQLLLIDLSRLARAEPSGGRGQERTVAEMFAYIEEHYGSDISLDDVAVGIARSPAHLARTVRRLTGRSVNDWIAERRMAEARALLTQTDAPIDEVARSTGFQDPAYFRRRFKRAHGFPPREWRRAAR
jgi:AraC-like DNA-binding protein